MAELTAARVRWFGLSDGCRRAGRERAGHRIRHPFHAGRRGACARRCALRILGEHHVSNALAALAVARELGVPTSSGPIAALEARSARRALAHGGAAARAAASRSSTTRTTPAPTRRRPPSRRSRRSASRNSAPSPCSARWPNWASTPTKSTTGIGRLVVRLNIGKLVVVGHGRPPHPQRRRSRRFMGRGVGFRRPMLDAAYDLLREDLRAGDIVLVKSSKSASLRFLGDRARRSRAAPRGSPSASGPGSRSPSPSS